MFEKHIMSKILAPYIYIIYIIYIRTRLLTNQRDRSYVYAFVYSVPTGQVVPTSGQVVDSTCEFSGVSTTDFYQLTGSVQLQLLNDSCSKKLPLSRNTPLLAM